MPDKPREKKKGGRAAVVVVALVVVLVLYVLSAGPVMYLVTSESLPAESLAIYKPIDFVSARVPPVREAWVWYLFQWIPTPDE